MSEARDLESLMGYLGDFGKYQAWQFCLHILSAVTAGLNMMSLVTVAAVPEHRCKIPEHDINNTYTFLNDSTLAKYLPRLDSGEFDSCSIYNAFSNASYRCDSFVYDRTYYQSSRAIEWEFVCDRRWMGAVAQSAYMFGVFTGAVVLGNLADKIGRKPVFCWSAVVQLILGIGVAFTPEYISFLVIRFIYGIVGSAGCYIPGFVLTMELVGPNKRSMCGVAFQGAFAVGIMLVAGWGALIKDRQLLQIIYGCHALLLVGHFWLMDESPRWLWNNGRIKESLGIIKKALKMNGNPINVDAAQFVSKGISESRTREERAGFLDLFRTPNLRKKTLNVMLCWFANAIVYYGLSLNTGSLQGNPFFIIFIMGLIEIPSYFVTVYLMDRWGRRSLTSLEMVLGGICCIVAVSVVQGPVSTSFVFAGKFLIASSFAVIYNYSAELFPTVIRSFAMGLGAKEDETLQVNLSKNEFGPEKIKDEDEMSIVHHDLKSEQCAEDVKEGFYCEGCGGGLLSLENFLNPDSVKSCCNCQYQNDANHGEGVTNDLKPPNFTSDCGIFSSKPPEETIVIKKEVTSENTSSTSCEKAFAVEIFSSGYYSNSFGESRIHEKNEVFSKNSNERIDEECVENKTTEEYPVHHKVCTKLFIGSSDLNNHIDSKPFQSRICTDSFNLLGNLKVHEKIRTGKKRFQCKICSKSFNHCSNLKNHERIHTGEKPFQCKICLKSFNDCSNLRNHERIHTGEKPFQCKICSKSFNQSSSLRMHEMIHTGVKPFQCKICSKSFIQKIYLKNHEKTHTGEKPFQCKNCLKSFNQVSNLKKHEKIHTGEKPFQCEFCLKSFNQSSNMKIHEKIHTGKKPFQ